MRTNPKPVGTKIGEVMTTRPRAVDPQTSVREAARLMESEDVGSYRSFRTAHDSSES